MQKYNQLYNFHNVCLLCSFKLTANNYITATIVDIHFITCLNIIAISLNNHTNIPNTYYYLPNVYIYFSTKTVVWKVTDFCSKPLNYYRQTPAIQLPGREVLKLLVINLFCISRHAANASKPHQVIKWDTINNQSAWTP